ncbi:hypothetical protein DFQ27_004530 [Actinomortierella ambigua]|uniref:AMP-dependent synthetase/ligase domain-containing protein n=1 Tax=Actinomortierella ambigua TaxID=1343610 RepID=A0A9P6U412_9FUNG|nr:hypothetical protein DFQ27_004530 [Actinomortierella ambigua]
MSVVKVDYNRQAIEMPGTRRPGQTGIFRRAGFEDELVSRTKGSPHVTTVYEGFQHGLKLNPNGDCLGSRTFDPVTGTFGEYVWQSYATVHQRVTRFGSGLMHLHQQLFPDLTAAQRRQWAVGIWGINRAEWTIAGEACSAYSLISVGLFDALDVDAVMYSINHSEAPAIVASAQHVLSLIKNADKMPGLKIIVSMDPLGGDNATSQAVDKSKVESGSVMRLWAEEKGIRLLDFKEVEALGELHGRKHIPPTPEELYTVGYTSGTTGLPKGAMTTHANYLSLLASNECSFPMFKDDTLFSYLPLGHVFGRVLEFFAFSVGGRIGYSSGDPLRLLEDMEVLKPTIFPTVPRLMNRIYARVRAATVEAPGMVGVLARRAVAAKMANYVAGLGMTHPLWDRLLFNKVKKVLGGNVRYMIIGSAPVASEILAFARIAFCCEVIEVYGQTEGTGAGTLTNYGDVTPNHVGAPAPCCEVKLIDVPELNYFATDKPYPRGEICLRGPSVIKGYLKDEKKTRETIDEEGFLHSGDVAILNPNGTFTIIDRVKNVFKLSQGEFIAAEKIENQILAKVPLIQQIFVHGDSTENCLVAIMVPEPENFVPILKQVLNTNVSPNDIKAFREACNHPKVRKAVLQIITNAGKAAQLKGFEFPKAVMIEPTPFSVENGRLTPTFKIKRHPVVKEYREQLTAMYNEIHQQSKI